MAGSLRFFATLCTMVTAFACALAQSSGVEKYKDYTPEQLRDLPRSELNTKVPMMYSFAARKGLAVDGKLSISMDLNLLMYPAIGDFVGAVKMFQEDIGEPTTGVLTVSQIHQLTARAEYQRLTPVSFMATHTSVLSRDFAHVTGTMKIIDDTIMWPVNHVDLWCYKPQRECEMRTTSLTLPRENDWFRQYTVLFPSRDYYRITRWEGNIIEAAPATNEQGMCRSATLSLNFQTKEFYEIAKNAGGNCTHLPKLEKPRVSQIVDGKEIIEGAFQAVQRKAYGFLSSRFRAQVDKAALSLSAK